MFLRLETVPVFERSGYFLLLIIEHWVTCHSICYSFLATWSVMNLYNYQPLNKGCFPPWPRVTVVGLLTWWFRELKRAITSRDHVRGCKTVYSMQRVSYIGLGWAAPTSSDTTSQWPIPDLHTIIVHFIPTPGGVFIKKKRADKQTD